jgi:hypothetical protein
MATPRAVYQFRITLQDIEPTIWRRIQVWEDITLTQFHDTLQTVMSWEDYHLHEFKIGRRIFSVPDPDDERSVTDESEVSLSEVICRVGAQAIYLYDFGDDWRHDLLLEAILLPEPEALYPRCITGERRTPPEDVGGTAGYQDYLEALADPRHEEHESVLLWRGPFDPAVFSPDEVNQQLRKRFRSPRKRKTPSAAINSPSYH